MIQAGVAGFKCFLIHSGMEEFPHVTDYDPHSHEASARHRKCPAGNLQAAATKLCDHSTVTEIPFVLSPPVSCRVVQQTTEETGGNRNFTP